MSTKKQKVITYTLIIIWSVIVNLIIYHVKENQEDCKKDIPLVQSSDEKIFPNFMGYLQELPDAGITKPLYRFMNSKNKISRNDFTYAYSFLTDTPCTGVGIVLEKSVSKTDVTKIEVHKTYSVKSQVVTSIPTPTTIPPTPTPVQKVYSTEDVSAEIQQDALYLANKYNVPVEILFGIAYKETRYKTGLVSADKHDYGFCQIRDVNHSWLERELGRELDFLNSAYDSMEAACYMLRNLKNKTLAYDDLASIIYLYAKITIKQNQSK